MAGLTDLLTVASWNVREGVPATGSAPAPLAIDEIVGMLQEHRVDVVGLQEVDFDAQRHSSILQAIRSRTDLAHTVYHVLSGSSFHPAGYAGVAIASRYELGDAQPRTFLNPGLGIHRGPDFICMHDKGLISAPVEVNDSKVTVTSLHAFPFHVFRRRAEEPEFSSIWTDISLKLAETMAPSRVICGDFNTARRDLVRQIPPASLRRAISDGITYMGESIDDILFSHDFSVASVSIIPNFSDHYFCLTTLSRGSLR